MPTDPTTQQPATEPRWPERSGLDKLRRTPPTPVARRAMNRGKTRAVAVAAFSSSV